MKKSVKTQKSAEAQVVKKADMVQKAANRRWTPEDARKFVQQTSCTLSRIQEKSFMASLDALNDGWSHTPESEMVETISYELEKLLKEVADLHFKEDLQRKFPQLCQ